jgi:acylglycerol lipase
VKRGWHLVAVLVTVLCLAACAPTVQRAAVPEPGFAGPAFTPAGFVAADGALLGLDVWQPPDGEPVRAVIVALHGMNDYAQAFTLAGPYWARRGIATYAYDARGFGRSPQRGVWGGERLMLDDLRTAVAVARTRHPGVPLAVVGESMGAATIMASFGTDRPVRADRVILLAPAVWGWSNLPAVYSATLWLGAHAAGGRPVTPPRVVTRRIRATDNDTILRQLGRDRLMLFETRIDAVFGLVRLMELAWRSAGALPAGTLFLYGANDQIVPPGALARTIARLPPDTPVVRYPNGWHMLTRDLQAEVVFADVAAFLEDPAAPLPSRLAVAASQTASASTR